MKTHALYPVAWLVAVVVAIFVGFAAVRTVGDTVQGRGPLGREVSRAGALADRSEGRARPDPSARVVRREISGDFGTFVVACQGVYTRGEDALTDRGGGWRVISFEPGPDDDVEAVFSNGRNSVEVEVFCNRGRPTVGELERNRLPVDDDR